MCYKFLVMWFRGPQGFLSLMNSWKYENGISTVLNKYRLSLLIKEPVSIRLESWKILKFPFPWKQEYLDLSKTETEIKFCLNDDTVDVDLGCDG